MLRPGRGVVLVVVGGCLSIVLAGGCADPAAVDGPADRSAGTPGIGEPTATGPAFVAGNPSGRAAVPAEASEVDTSNPARVVGNGAPASCSSAAVVEAVAAGGIITFSCGPRPLTITMTATAKIRNANGPRIVVDGGGLITLSGGGRRRILYMNTCDQAQGWWSTRGSSVTAAIPPDPISVGRPSGR